jgi:anti-sigma factor RsiW
MVSMRHRNLGTPLNRHIDSKELEAFALSPSGHARQFHGLSPDALREAERHMESCGECSEKVLKYRQLASRSSSVVVSRVAPPGDGCPGEKDVDWHEVAAGLWPELNAKQLIMHAATCDHCGPRLRAATSVDDDPTVEEERLLAQLRAPSRPVVKPTPKPTSSQRQPVPVWRQFLEWRIFVPAVALTLIVAVLSTRPSSLRTPLSGPQFAEFAVNTHRQRAQGTLVLDLQSDSQRKLNEWLQANSQLARALPESPAPPGEERPFRLEGARLIPVGNKTAAYIAYRMQSGPVGLIVTPTSVALASDGIQVDFKKVSFHYAVIRNYKVVTWSVHGLTYALVSQEGNRTQQSCMVCHSAMRDRDMSHMPTPLGAEGSRVEPALKLRSQP